MQGDAKRGGPVAERRQVCQSKNLTLGLFTQQRFFCNERLMQWVAINWRFLYFYCNTLRLLLVTAELL